VPDDAANRDDRLAAAVAELYQAAPEDFTGRRGELAAAARDAGDRAEAKAIAALRKPTRAAWVVNRLVHTDPGAPRRLAELASALSAAQQAGHGPRLRELSAARWALIDRLTAQALAAAGVPDPPPSLRLEVAQTISAALADPGVAAEFAAGTLTKAAQWSGFGLAPEPAGTGGDAGGGSGGAGTDTVRGGEEPAETLSARRGRLAEETGPKAGTVPSPRKAADQPATERAPAASRTSAARPRAAAETRAPKRTAPGAAEPVDRRRAADAQRRAEAARQEAAERSAREAAERAARRREQYEEAERTVAAAAAAAAEAIAAEDRLEAGVRDLEERLTQARAELAAARMRARHAETAQRRAQQAFDRIPRPGA
jgi:hypothetical protein